MIVQSKSGWWLSPPLWKYEWKAVKITVFKKKQLNGKIKWFQSPPTRNCQITRPAKWHHVSRRKLHAEAISPSAIRHSSTLEIPMVRGSDWEGFASCDLQKIGSWSPGACVAIHLWFRVTWSIWGFTRPGKRKQKTNWKDPPCYQWLNQRYISMAMASSSQTVNVYRRPGTWSDVEKKNPRIHYFIIKTGRLWGYTYHI